MLQDVLAAMDLMQVALNGAGKGSFCRNMSSLALLFTNLSQICEVVGKLQWEDIKLQVCVKNR